MSTRSHQQNDSQLDHFIVCDLLLLICVNITIYACIKSYCDTISPSRRILLAVSTNVILRSEQTECWVHMY
jgi:hypothetical protein